MIKSTKDMLKSKFDMKDMGLADVILGIKIIRTQNRLVLSQAHYVDKILNTHNVGDSGLARTPIDTSLHLSKNRGVGVTQLEYSRIIGMLMYLMTSTRPDLAYDVSRLSRYTSNPGNAHWKDITRVLHYVRYSRDYGLDYDKHPAVMEGYSDANWISDVKDSRSTSGYVFTLEGAAISWKSSKQTVIAKSTMESEFIALDKCEEEAKWLRQFVEDIPRCFRSLYHIGALRSPRSELRNELKYVQNGDKMNEISCLKKMGFPGQDGFEVTELVRARPTYGTPMQPAPMERLVKEGRYGVHMLGLNCDLIKKSGMMMMMMKERNEEEEAPVSRTDASSSKEKEAQVLLASKRGTGDMTKESGDTSKKEVSTTSIPQFQCSMLKPSNYSLWAIRMQIILEANGLWEMIEPLETTQADNKKDKTAIAFIYQALPEEQLLQITKHKTTKAIWDALKARHIGEERVQQARLQTLKSDFEMLHMKEDETIDTFTGKLTTLVNKAASLGHTIGDQTLVRKLLNVVPGRYLQIVASIEQYSNLSEMTMEEAIGRLKTYEERIKYKKGRQVDNQEKLMFTRHESKGKYFRGRKRGKHKFSKGKSHEKFKEDRKDGESSHRNFNRNNFKKSSYDTSKLQCYQYNGASNHMTGVREHFKDLDEKVSGKVRFGNGSYIEIKGKGSILIECDDEKQRIISHTKKDANGNIIKHKARLVANGNILEHGIDFKEVFAPVARMGTIRLLLAIAANNKWEVHHLDVKSAFQHGESKEEVYVTQPEGFMKIEDNGKVYRLIKALYRPRQAPRAWNIKLDNTLKSLDFKKCALEQAIYTKTSIDSTLLIEVYVDDLIITGTPKKEIDKLKAQMEEKFKMSDLGLLAYYLGIEVTKTGGDISMKESAYANKILKEAGMRDCNETLIPMDPGTRLTKLTEGTMVNSTEY
nr:ribonuclease H-like domain, reverse transcriptase, RNA-dependent DNA polymerase [Tanacetum cinerariifolium]